MALSATRIEEPLPLCTRLINFSLSGPYSRHLYSILLAVVLALLPHSFLHSALGHTAYQLFTAGFALPAYMFSGSKEYRHPIRYLNKNTETPPRF